MKMNNNLEKNINDIINGYISSNQKQVYNDLIKTWRIYIEKSEKIINDISSKKDFIEKNADLIEDFLNKLNYNLDYNNELGINIDTYGGMRHNLHNIRRTLEKNYRILSFKYYKYMFESNKNRIEESFEQSKSIRTDFENSEKKLDSINEKIESLGGTFLNIVLTISIVSSMVAVLLNVKPEYAIVIVITCAWLLLSSILFISEYYKKDSKEENASFGKKVFYSLSVVAFITYAVLFTNAFRKQKNLSNKIYFEEKESISQYITIEDKNTIHNFLNSFSNYWKENDDSYIPNIELLNTDYISKIIFYKHTRGNIDYYEYDILLLNNKSISLKLNDSDLKEWLYQNNLLIK